MTEKKDGTTEYTEDGVNAAPAPEETDGALSGVPEIAAPENAPVVAAPENAPVVAAPENAPEVTTEVETAEEKTGDPQAANTKKKKVKKILWNVFLVVIIVLGVWVMFRVAKEITPEASGSFKDVMRNINPLFACAFVLVVLGIMVLDTTKYCIISKTVTGKFRLSSSIKVNLLGKYYDAVTPFSTGGQPMQIYYLNTKGISGGNSSAIVLIRYITSILTWIILGTALMVYGQVKGLLNGVGEGANVLKICGWIGIGVNLIIPVFVLFFVILPRFMYKLTNGFVRLGHKMKIVKDVDKATARATKVVGDFKSSFKIMATTPLNFILLILVSFIEAAFTFSVPFFVMKAFNCSVDGMLITVMSLNAFAIFGASFVPTPGNAGVVESMGAIAFKVAAGPAAVWSALFWRFGVYYIYIIIGLCLTFADIIRKNIKHKKKRAK